MSMRIRAQAAALLLALAGCTGPDKDGDDAPLGPPIDLLAPDSGQARAGDWHDLIVLVDPTRIENIGGNRAVFLTPQRKLIEFLSYNLDLGVDGGWELEPR